jgi:V/A-type H+-transporting ATPase subunit F
LEVGYLSQAFNLQAFKEKLPIHLILLLRKSKNYTEVGLVLVSDDLTEEINDKLTKLRAEQSTPLVFALPASGSEKSEVDYRVMLKKILGV